MELLTGLSNVLHPGLLLYCFIGCVLGTLVGVLPGLGPPSALSILLPITVYLDPLGAIVMMSGLYYGAAYGGSTTSILVNIPGEMGAVPTTFDGFPMTKAGRAGEALWMAAVASFIAGTLGAVALSVVGPGVAKIAVQFGPPEYFGLIVFSMTAIVSLAGRSLSKGVAAGAIGILLGTVGTDPQTGVPRFAYGSVDLMRGLDLVAVSVGLFGIGEILLNIESGLGKIYEGKIGRMMPRGEELKKGLKASLRGTALGFPLGLLPGVTPGVVGFLAYDIERKVSKYPQKFGTGVIEGVGSVEAANNATAQAGFLPLMALGLPTGASTALILAALMMYGLQPGPMMFQGNSNFVWTVIASMYVGNIMLLILNLPLVGLWARLSTIPYKYLGPFILAICIVGAYASRNSMFDVWIALGAGVVGYLMKKFDWPLPPLILGLILGPLLEQSLRQSLSMGGWPVLLQHPITLFFFALAAGALFIAFRFLKKVPDDVLEDNLA